MKTMDDIALAANVSRTTVSNVISGKTGRVSDATVRRVRKIIQDAGYVPNLSARSLASHLSKVVALINYVHSESDSSFDDPFTSSLTNAVEFSMRKNGYYLMLRTVANAAELKAFLLNWNIDGFFITGVTEGDEIHQTLLKIDKPIVLCDSHLTSFGNMVNIGLQDAEGAKLALEYLLKHNHTRIAFCSPPFIKGGVIDKRMQGYKQALADAGINFDPNLVFASGFSSKESTTLGATIAKRNDITAIFATADLLAAGIIAGINNSGKKVPRDYSIVGFDDLNWSSLISPGLTTIRQDMRLKGQRAADLMTNMLEGGSPSENIVLPVTLVERCSVERIYVF